MSTKNVSKARFARNVKWDFFLWFSNTVRVTLVYFITKCISSANYFLTTAWQKTLKGQGQNKAPFLQLMAFTEVLTYQVTLPVTPLMWHWKITVVGGYVTGLQHHHSGMVFENHRKSLIQHCGRSELSLHFERTKVD